MCHTPTLTDEFNIYAKVADLIKGDPSLALNLIIRLQDELDKGHGIERTYIERLTVVQFYLQR
jgi:hypothetical protein